MQFLSFNIISFRSRLSAVKKSYVFSSDSCGIFCYYFSSNLRNLLKSAHTLYTGTKIIRLGVFVVIILLTSCFTQVAKSVIAAVSVYVIYFIVWPFSVRHGPDNSVSVVSGSLCAYAPVSSSFIKLSDDGSFACNQSAVFPSAISVIFPSQFSGCGVIKKRVAQTFNRGKWVNSCFGHDSLMYPFCSVPSSPIFAAKLA